MRIGLVTNMMDSQNAGIGRYTENLVKNLLLIDKKNEYFLIHTRKVKYDFSGNYQEIRLPFFDSIPKKLITGAFFFEKICRDYKLDILHDLGQISPFFFKSKTKKILTIHDLSPVIVPQCFTKLTQIYSKLFPVILKKTDHIITVSINSKRDIQNIYKISENKISVIGEGVDNRFKTISNKQLLDRVRKKYHLPKRFILFVGTIEPRKNLPLLLSAFAKIKDKFGIKLIVVGKLGWKYENIFNTASQLKIKNDFIFTGFVEDNDLPAIYNLAKVFVYPSYYEGFGLPVLEAMACGCPVITSSTSSLSEIVGNAAILINPTNIKDITEVILKIVSNKKLKLELIKQGLKQVKKFNWQNCAKKTLNVYQSLNYA